ncbi:collagen alpha-6(VI) chain isoform X1 [Pygocentrus nattereri]|uniref:Collagen type VI alpha 6 chain n=1 Tax=Pygocentrus nattereri TaxID=42514 RepID=A0A3B4CZP4_PYGNA|nr:collagen alpha-6(VI) chain isoform X1 [Pygocentrus nattereri]
MGFIKGLLSVFILASCFLSSGAQKTVCTEEALADIVFLVDGSWSIGTENFQRIREFLFTLVDSFDVGPDKVRIGLVQYSNSPRTEFSLNSYESKQEIHDYIANLPYMGGGTKTGLGLNFLLKDHFREEAGSRAKMGVTQIAVVITDGQSQDNVEVHAQELKRQGIILYAIGIKDADMDQLKEIATKPHDKHIYSVSDFTALQGISEGFIHVLCTTVEEAKRQVSHVPQGCKANLADIVFLVDGSSSIGDEDFLKVKQFIHTFIEGLDVRSDKIRVGLVQFSNDPHQEILLGKYTDKNELLEKVNELIYRKGGTETGKALSFLQNHYFTQAGGSRIGQNVPQIAVVITDGDSSDDMKKPATELRNKGVLIFTIGVGEVNITELQSIANKPHWRFLINFSNYQELVKATASTMDRVCVSVEDKQEAAVPKFADVFVLVDSSIQQTDELRKFLMVLINQLNVSTKSNRMALAQFSEDVSVEFLFNAYKNKNEVVALIRKLKLQTTGQRNLGKAMDFVRTRLLNADSGSRIGQGFKQYLLVVSKGQSDDTQSDVIRAARDMKSEGVTIVNIDLSKKGELVFALAPGPASRGDGGLPPVKKTMIASPRKTFFTAEKNVTQITQDIKSVIATSEGCESAQLADIVFIVDVSNAVQNFKLVRNFLYQMINGLEISADSVRVGMVLYSDTPRAEFHLNEFDNKHEILDYINILRYSGGRTNTGMALKLSREEVFSEDFGSRRAQGVPQIAVVITEGKSHDDVTIEASELKRSGVSVYALGRENYNIDQLKEIASYPSWQFVFSVKNFDKLYTEETPLRKTLCNRVAFSTFDSTNYYNLKQGCRQIEEADIYFLIDDSGSITHSNFDDMRKFIREFLQLFKIGPKQVRIGLAKYADSPTLEFDLTTYNNRESIVRAVNEILHKGGGTNTGAALKYMERPFEEARKTRKNVPQILIVITDGKSSDEVKVRATDLRKQGVSIYAIGVKDANEKELLEIADDEKKVFFVTNYDALSPLKKDILTYMCSNEACKNMFADIIFLVDGSLSIGNDEFSKMTEFVGTLVSKLKIGKDSAQVGLVQFSTVSKAEVALNQYYDMSEMTEAINGIQKMNENTLIGNALDYVSVYFDPPEGGRPTAPKFLIVITDGESQDEVSAPAKALRDKGVTIYSIGVREANLLQLRNISGSPSNVFMQRDFDALKFLEKDLLLKICSSADECQKSQVADVVFLVDGSSSIAEKDFESMKDFMNLVVNSTQVGQDNVRFCSIVYSDAPESKFPLNLYSSKREVNEAIGGIKAPGGNTYTARALQYSLAYFDQTNGGRAKRGIPQMMFVITDGEATDKGELPKRAEELQNHGISVYGIGVAEAKISELKVITKDEKKVFHVNDYDALKALHHKISAVLCNDSKPECKKEAADLVILIDGSESIDKAEWTTMMNFMLRLVDNLRIREDLIRVGVAQFSTGYQKEFYLNEKMNAKDVKDAIRGIEQLSEGTRIGNALSNVHEFFAPSKGSRIKSGISQNLLLITDGKSKDTVKEPAKRLRDRNIEMFVIGIGHISLPQLNDIAGSSKRLFIVDNFDTLKLNRTTQEVIDILCTKEEQEESPDCTVDIGIGFDVSRVGTSSQSLFSGQSKLQTYLRQIAKQISVLNNLCCLKQPTVDTKTAFRLVARNGNLLYDTGFGEYSDDVINKIMAQQITQPLAFNSRLLQSFQDMLKASNAGVKVVIIFTDGLDDSVEVLMRSSEELRKSGVHALLLVALEGVRSTTDLQKLEFGRGFDYKEPLTIGMPNVASTIHKQIDTVALRECCNVTCKCTGHDGVQGPRGPPGYKGLPGLKGHPGYPGEEGGMGDRGTPGLNGTQGHQGCPGRRGQKGNRGYRGDMGEAGEDGVDGINGEQGVAGSAGPKGEPGDLGSPGQSGSPGEPGVPGEKGLRGDPGEPGFDNNIRGPKGDVGNPGLPGEIGQDGNPGILGESGKPGQKGRRGDAGLLGLRGPAGTPGLQGLPGPTGPQGPIGPNGVPGQKGTFGLPGPQGRPGNPGGKGSKGNIGSRGQKGQLGNPGDEGSDGPLGPRGLPGSDGQDGYGVRGPKGHKGDMGFPGYPGLQGEAGDGGTPGANGRKGNRGRGGNSGRAGTPGDPGSEGPPGHRGTKGPPGSSAMSPCSLITFVRDNCDCCKANATCPAYPTELVIGLDMSNGVTEEVFRRMRNAVLSLLHDINFAESNCPTGARVAVVSYSSNTKYLIRFSDYQRKKDLMEAVNNIALERTTNQRNIGAAMLFVGRNVFKRVRQGVLMRKVAIFLTAGPSQDQSPIVTAVLEYKALDINLGVIAFRSAANVRRAFEADETGSFILALVERPRDQSAAIERIQNCVVCFDPCRPSPICPDSSAALVPKEVDMDLALLVDGSRLIKEDEYKEVKQVLATVLDQLAVSRQPRSKDNQARVALYQQSSTYSEAQAPVKQIFNFQQYRDRKLMKQSIFQDLQKTGGSSQLGHALDFVITKGLLTVSQPRKYKMLLVVVGEETDYYDQDMLDIMSRAAKCEGIVSLIFTVGNRFNSTQVEELASIPVAQHIVHLSQVKQQEQEYAQRFLRTFLQTLIKSINVYQTQLLRGVCDALQSGVGKGQGKADVYETVESPTIDWYPLPTTAYAEEGEEEVVEQEEDTSYIRETGTHLTPSRGDLDAQCLLDKDTGIVCRDYVQRWYYDSALDACSIFWYGGCGGNNNRFRTEIECMETCSTNNVCLLKNDPGPCRAYILKWFYNTELNRCTQFWYGGCEGNSNRFDTVEKCEARCITLDTV